MKKKSSKFSFSLSTVVIILSVFIIAESVWLVAKLEEISQKSSIPEASSSTARSQTAEPAASFQLLGPERVNKGERFSVSLKMESKDSFSSHGLDVVLGYDPALLGVVGEALVASESPFQTAGLNAVEPEKKRILVTLLDLGEKGVAFARGEESFLFSLEFEALAEGEASLFIQDSQQEARKTQIIDLSTNEPLPLNKSDLKVSII